MNFDSFTNVIDVYIRYLRRKVDDPFENKLIHTRRGVGYVLAASPEPSIRWRIVLAVFLLVAVPGRGPVLYVLSRVQHSCVRRSTRASIEDLGELRAVLRQHRARRRGWIRPRASTGAGTRSSSRSATRGSAGVARSDNVPGGRLSRRRAAAWRAAGEARLLGSRTRAAGAARAQRARARDLGRTAGTCGRGEPPEVQRWYWALRKNLVTSLVAVRRASARSRRTWCRARARCADPGDRRACPRARRPARRHAAAHGLGRRARSAGRGAERDARAHPREVLCVRRMSADAAHALRTPLTVMRGNLELQAAPAPARGAPSARRRARAGRRAGPLLNRLLLLEKLEGGRSASARRACGSTSSRARAGWSTTLQDRRRRPRQSRSTARRSRRWCARDPSRARQAIAEPARQRAAPHAARRQGRGHGRRTAEAGEVHLV